MCRILVSRRGHRRGKGRRGFSWK